MSFVHLHVHSPYSFLDGASGIAQLARQAASAGMPALALTDHNSVSGALQFRRIAKSVGLKPIQGVELNLTGNHHLTLLAQDRLGYANLCRLLSHAHLSSPRGEPALPRESLRLWSGNLVALSGCRKGEIPSLIRHRRWDEALDAGRFYRDVFGRDNFFIELANAWLPGEKALNSRLVELAEQLGVGVVASNNVHYETPSDFPAHDILTCIRTLTTLDEVHPDRRLNAENWLKPPTEMAALFRDTPQALHNTLRVAEMCAAIEGLDAPHFPNFTPPDGLTPAAFLRHLVYTGAEDRYRSITEKVRTRLEHELSVICRLGFEEYFLAVWDVARFAREKRIQFAGRGSAADSAVAYCLGLTTVDSIKRNLLFERFMSLERAQRPDIDIDFEADRRDEVARYIYDKYGSEHVATVCTFNTFHGRSAVRDLGKALGLTEEMIDALAGRLPHVAADDIESALSRYPELRDSRLPYRQYQQLIQLAGKVAGFPRHIGTHLGGLVISRDPLTEITPLQMAAKGVVITQFDKDDIEDLGLVKLDLLCLRTLSAVRETLSSLPGVDYAKIPEEQATYQMLREGETIGVFQLESPAQRALQSRLGARDMEDIIASVALIRPGPIEGNMVEPFVARRAGQEPISYLHPKLEPILKKTYGVVLFQEQVIEIATVIAGFTPGEADRLRRVMTHFRSRQEMDEIGRLFISKAVTNGVSQEVAGTIFSYVVGYAGYGFCEAHAAAFADTAYKTAYLVKHYPAEFFAALLSNQPMGFYPPNTLCVEARRRGIAILPPDVNRSGERFTAESQTIRVSLAVVKGMSASALQSIIQARRKGPFRSLVDFLARVEIDRPIIENLVLCGAFDSLYANRRQLFWRLGELAGAGLGTGAGASAAESGGPSRLDLTYGEQQESREELSDFSPWLKFGYEYELLGIGVTAHLMQFYRDSLTKAGIRSTDAARKAKTGETVEVAGVVIRPHRPPTRSGRTVVFLSLEDEVGLMDVTVFENIYQQYGKLLFGQPALIVRGRVDRRGRGVSVIAREVRAIPDGLRKDTPS